MVSFLHLVLLGVPVPIQFKDNWDGDKQLTFVVTSRGGVAASEPQVVEHDVAFGG